MLNGIGLYHLIALKMCNTDADILLQHNKLARDDNTHTRGARTGLSTATRPTCLHWELCKVEQQSTIIYKSISGIGIIERLRTTFYLQILLYYIIK